MTKHPTMTEHPVYGHCPQCGREGAYRDRSPTGNTYCAARHAWPSKAAATATTPASVETQPQTPQEAVRQIWTALRDMKADAAASAPEIGAGVSAAMQEVEALAAGWWPV